MANVNSIGCVGVGVWEMSWIVVDHWMCTRMFVWYFCCCCLACYCGCQSLRLLLCCVPFHLTDNFATWNRANERMNHHNFSTLLSEAIDLPLTKLNVPNNVLNMDAMPCDSVLSLSIYLCLSFPISHRSVVLSLLSVCVMFNIQCVRCSHRYSRRFLAISLQTDCSTYQK